MKKNTKKKNDLFKIFEKHLKININEKKKWYQNYDNIKLNQYRNWDSLTHASILIEIEKKFNININSKNVHKFNNLSSIIKLLKL
jgi:acyl carrier protein